MVSLETDRQGGRGGGREGSHCSLRESQLFFVFVYARSFVC